MARDRASLRVDGKNSGKYHTPILRFTRICQYDGIPRLSRKLVCLERPPYKINRIGAKVVRDGRQVEFPQNELRNTPSLARRSAAKWTRAKSTTYRLSWRTSLARIGGRVLRVLVSCDHENLADCPMKSSCVREANLSRFELRLFQNAVF